MSSVWDVMKAVRASDLVAPARLIVLTLAGLADHATGIIPDRYSPSLSDLAGMTGLGRSTIAGHLNALEETKWIDRQSPSVVDAWSKKETNRYAVRVGTSPVAALVQELDHSDHIETGDVGSGLVQETDSTSPGAGHEVLTKNTPKNKNSSPRKTPAENPPRPDVDEICAYLVDKIEALGVKRPTVTQKWRDQARLLLDERRSPQPTVERVKALIDWIHTDAFWHRNILSMPTLRDKYDKVRLAAVADFNAKAKPPAQTGRANVPPSAPEKVPIAEQCPEHPGRRADGCGLCRAARIGSPKSTERRAS